MLKGKDFEAGEIILLFVIGIADAFIELEQSATLDRVRKMYRMLVWEWFEIKTFGTIRECMKVVHSNCFVATFTFTLLWH